MLAGAPDALLDTYEEERRPIAAQMAGLANKRLEAAKRGERRRGREVHQLDMGYPESSLVLETAEHSDGVTSGVRSPESGDAFTVRGLPHDRSDGELRRSDLARGFNGERCPSPRASPTSTL
jgi:hypothetical protein